jgi:CRP-like cAMP-binding protein
MIPVAQEAVSCPARPLDLVERIVLLRKAAPFREAGLDALAELARQLDEKRWDPGSMVMSAGEMGHRIEILVCGQVECHEQTRDLDYIVGAGFALGVMEAYAGVRRDYHAVALDHVVSLSLSAGMMIDLMEDHPDIADSIIAIMARTTLRYARALAVQGSDVHGDEPSS